MIEREKLMAELGELRSLLEDATEDHQQISVFIDQFQRIEALRLAGDRAWADMARRWLAICGAWRIRP